MAVNRGANGAGRPSDPAASQLQIEIEQTHRELEHLFALLQRRLADEADLRRTIAALEAERQQLLADARRIQASRAWRYGHGAMRVFGRLTRRARGDEGAIDLMVDRLSRPHDTLAAPTETGPEVRGRLAAVHDQQARHQPLQHQIASRSAQPVTIVIPVFNASEALGRCLESVVRNTGPWAKLVLIDDASTDPRVGELLAAYAQLRNVEVLTNPRNLGFTASINRGILESAGDVVLLNSDTEVGPRWLEQLVIAASTASDIGTVTAVSDNAGAFSVPEIGVENALPEGFATDDVARLFAQSSRRRLVPTPTGSGFCLFVRRACLDEVGPFDEAEFPRGYGEENDFCMRAAELGWRHVIDDATWVHHQREASFGPEKQALAGAARATVDRLHPTYTEQVRAFVTGPDLAAMHEDARAAYKTIARPGAGVLPRILFVLHEGGGGVPASNRDLLRGLVDRYDCLVLASDGSTLRLWQAAGADMRLVSAWRLAEPWRVTDTTSPEQSAIARTVLASYGIELVHVRHLFKHTLDLPRVATGLGLPVVVSLHDYYMSCPTVHLLDETDTYCGGICTPGDGACRIPSPMLMGTPPLKHRYVHEWRRSFARILANADALVTTSDNVREVYLRSYPTLRRDAFRIIEHGRDLVQVDDVAVPPRPGERIRILVPGNLDVHKGADLLTRLKELDEDGRLEFHFLGSVDAAYRHLGTHHGTYAREEFAERARAIGPAFVGIFSITAETYSHSLTEAWAAGIPVLASNMGALEERIGRHGGGWTLPVDDPEMVYRRICAAADDLEEYERRRAAASIDGLADVAEMAGDYHALYQEVLARRRSFVSDGTGALARFRPAALRVAAYMPFRTTPPPASSHVRVLRRLAHPHTGWNIAGRIARDDSLRELRDCDVAFVQRDGISSDLAPRFLEAVRRADLKLVVDVDDDLFALGAHHAVYGAGLRAFRLMLDESDLVIVTSERLRDALGVAPERSAVLPNMHDEHLWFTPTDDGAGADGPADRRLRLMFMGTRTHAEDLAFLRPVLDTLRRECGIPCELFVVGGADPSGEEPWYTEIDVPHSAYPRFVPWLRARRHTWDVALAPLCDTDFNRGKSDLKLLDYGALELAGVYSDVPAFDTCVDGVTGLKVANTVDAWVAAIERLAREVDLRDEIARNAFEYVRDHRTLSHEGTRWIGALTRPLSTRPAPIHLA